MLTANLDWRDARCREVGTELFYVDRGDGQAAREADHSVQAEDPNEVRSKVCAECPLRLPCLQYALDNEEQFGIWGGMTPRQRLRILRQRKNNPNWRWSLRSVNEKFIPKFCKEGHAIEGANVFVDYRGVSTCKHCREVFIEERYIRERDAQEDRSYQLQ